MNKEEKEFFYSIGRGSLNLNGKFYYGLDYSITDFMNSLEEENKKYKDVIDKLEKYIRLTVSEEEFIETEHYVELLDILKEVE